jgi:hypothetical protein
MAANGNYAATPRAAVAQLTAANTARDGTGTIVSVITGATTGTRVDDLVIQATGATTAGMIRLFLSLDGGTTSRLIREIPVTAITPSATVQAFSASLTNLALLLPNASAVLRASTNNAETFNIAVVRAGDF